MGKLTACFLAQIKVPNSANYNRFNYPGTIMQTQKNHFPVYIIIVLGLFIAFSPAILSNNYLRQDDLMWEIWPWMKVSDFGYLYYNTIFQLVRPVCMLSFYVTDLISLNMHHSVFVRLMSIILTGILGLLLYRWQLFFNSNRMMAATFAVAALTLPAYQVFIATANYSLIISALLLTLCALFFWYRSFAPAGKVKNKYLFIGCILFYISLLDYPLSSMYGWTLLAICYLNSFTTTESSSSLATKRKFFYSTAKLILLIMVAYFITIILVHVLFNVNLHYGNRPGTLETAHLFSRLLWIFDTLLAHSSLWLWGTSHFQPPLSLIAICALFLIALIRTDFIDNVHNIKTIVKNSIISFASIFILFFMAYSPVFATSERVISFRYALATMPILLYVIFWSLNQLTYNYKNTLPGIPKTLCSLIYIIIAIFGICYANLMMSDGIVGPHENDFRYVQQQLTDKVIPLLQQGKKVLIHAIDCDSGKNYPYANNLPTMYEYGMRTCQYQQQVIGVIIHSLMIMGYPSNYHQHNTVIYKENEIQVVDTPWGALIVNSVNNFSLDQHKYPTDQMTVVTIDMRKIPPYNRFDFYKGLLKIPN